MPSEIATDGEQRNSESEENREEVPLDRGTEPSDSDSSSTSASLSSSDSGTENENERL